MSYRNSSVIIISLLFLLDLVGLFFSKMTFSSASLILLASLPLFWLIALQVNKHFVLSSTIQHFAVDGFLLLLFSIVGFLFSYLMIEQGGALHDEFLVHIDHLIGFNWLAYNQFFMRHPSLHLVALILYILTIVFIGFALLYFNINNQFKQAERLVTLVLFGGIFCVSFAYFLPSAGGVGYYLPDEHFYQGNHVLINSDYLQHFFDLRAGKGMEVSFFLPQAMVAFPSYHAYLAVVVILIFKNETGLFPVMLVINIATLCIIPVEGGHHLIDVIIGGGMAVVCYWWLK